jgi:hypothetical protein
MLDRTTRLYVSPLTPELLPNVLGPATAAVAKNISFHEIQTFPEHNYGYLELPGADADRLKKKLSGAIFRGNKMKVEEARPKKRTRAEDDDEGKSSTAAKPQKRIKSRREPVADNVISGHELDPQRKIERGWTEHKKEKASKRASRNQKPSSKYTEKEELLFRTKVPANKTDLATKTSKKSKKTGHNAEEHTVHEFQNTTTQPSFLKSDPADIRSNLEYVDGKGWVDETGEVVESEPASIERTKARLASQRKGRIRPVGKPSKNAEAVDSSSSSTSSASSSSSSSHDDNDEDMARLSATPSVPPGTTHPTSEGNEIHPLESLFKKPQKPASQDVAKPSLEISTGFSFFDSGDEDTGDEPAVPLTPFSQDTRARGLRSAAPTPDTAHPSRFNSYDSVRFLGEEASEEGEDEGSAGALQHDKEDSRKQLRSDSKPSDKAGVSDFEKQFWEKRGENNRAWKGRRRAVLKEKRHRENRARRPKNW